MGQPLPALSPTRYPLCGRICGRCRAAARQLQTPRVLQTPLGELALTPEQSAGHAPGAALQLLLRADELVLDAASPLQATITQVQFRGSLQLCTLQLPTGHAVLLQSSSAIAMRVGQSVTIAARLNSLVLFSS